METVQKPWGKEEIIFVTDKYAVKQLYMDNGKRCSLQYHEYKTETIYVISGVLFLYCGDQKITMNPGNYYSILPGEIHRMEGGADNTVYLECSTPELDDVVRVEDDYGR